MADELKFIITGILFCLTAFFLISDDSLFNNKEPKSKLEAYKQNNALKTVTYTFEEGREIPKVKSYSINQDNPHKWHIESQEKREMINSWRYENQKETQLKEDYIDKRTKNWYREIDGEIIAGYSDEEDELYYKFKDTEELNPDRIIE